MESRSAESASVAVSAARAAADAIQPSHTARAAAHPTTIAAGAVPRSFHPDKTRAPDVARATHPTARAADPTRLAAALLPGELNEGLLLVDAGVMAHA